jgi:hypothetical protein
VTARDASNNTATSVLTVTYAADAVDTGSSPGIDTMTIGIVLLVVIVLIVGVLFVVRRRKK